MISSLDAEKVKSTWQPYYANELKLQEVHEIQANVSGFLLFLTDWAIKNREKLKVREA
jgi:hypothetical protein